MATLSPWPGVQSRVLGSPPGTEHRARSPAGVFFLFLMSP